MKPKMLEYPKLYPDTNPWDVEPHYSRHVGAMTREGLDSKADIAVQLAWRDQEIENLRTQLQDARALQAELSRVYRDEHEQIAPLLAAAARNKTEPEGVQNPCSKPTREQLRATRVARAQALKEALDADAAPEVLSGLATVLLFSMANDVPEHEYALDCRAPQSSEREGAPRKPEGGVDPYPYSHPIADVRIRQPTELEATEMDLRMPRHLREPQSLALDLHCHGCTDDMCPGCCDCSNDK
jgi:hypothetical protein